MIRIVPTGDIGFDVILGGGWRLIERVPQRESATVVLRGGPGTGKTLLSVDVALAIAKALNGDVVVACVEILPSEYLAQIEAGRSELVLKWRDGPAAQDTPVVILPTTTQVVYSTSPRIFCGLLPELNDVEPDLVAALESMQKEVLTLNGKPKVFVVDSLIASYGLGPSSPRQNVDAVMKFAAREGLALVLCEEATNDTPSAWEFAADTVLALEHDRAGDRKIFVQKHRYGASATGVHQLEIRGWKQPRVYPRPEAWLDGHRIKMTLGEYGWSFVKRLGSPPLRWIDGLGPEVPVEHRCSFAIVSAHNLEVARKLAFGLVPTTAKSEYDILIDIDPLRFASGEWSWPLHKVHGHDLPAAAGAKAAICGLVEYLGRNLFHGDITMRPRRIIIGDIATLAAFTDHALWAEAIAVVATLVAESGSGIPVIAYDSRYSTDTGSLGALRQRADLKIDANGNSVGVTSLRDGTVYSFSLNESIYDPPKKALTKLPRARG